MPREIFHDDYGFVPRKDILSFEEIRRLVSLAVEHHGVTKLRVTGGEPLLRRDLPRLVRMLAGIDGVLDVALTTNGHLLAEHADALADAGLKRVTISLDALDADTFTRMSGGVPGLARVLQGIDAAQNAGLSPLKLNCVVVRGMNEHAVEDLARRFHGTDTIVRFIEFMDVGTRNGWNQDAVVGADEIRARIERVAALEPLESSRPGEVAERYRYRDGGGEVGIIASVTRPFCGTCSRGRLSADGRLLTCLFSDNGVSLRDRLRSGASDPELAALMGEVWRTREDRYSESRAALDENIRTKRRLEMYQVGG
jgi:cyclic pyranopterin phosphate synthase